MTPNTVGAYLQSNVVALSAASGGAFMQVAMPSAESQCASLTIDRGERFAVSRGVAIVPIKGLLTPNMVMFERYLGWSTYDGIEETAATLIDDDEVSGVVLDIDSPGGMVRGIQAAVAAVAALASVKPVHALVNPLAASAAYWVASQATEITMTAGAECGCIGTRVIASSPVEPDHWGDQHFELSSSHARSKNPDPATEVGQTELRRHLDESEAKFHADVAAGRNASVAELLPRIASTDDPQDGGAVFGADDAIARGLADRSESRAVFYDRIMSAYAPEIRPSQSRAFAARAAAARANAAI